MKTFKGLTAALFALALLAVPAAALVAAPIAPPQGMRAHSDAWHDVALDHHASARLTYAVSESSREQWRGGMAEYFVRPAAKSNRAVTSPVKPVARAHNQEWDDSNFDRNVSVRIKPAVTEATDSRQWQGCHANKDHYLSAALAAPQH